MRNTPHALDALAADFQRHGHWLQRLANGLVLDASEADDLLQEAWLAAAGATHRPAPVGRAWLAGILANVARAGRRAAGRRRARESRAVALHLEQNALAVSSEERLAREQRLLALVASLPASQRDAIVARYFDELSPAAIARRDGLTVDAVKSRLKRGLEALRARIEREEPGLHGFALWLAPLARGRRNELASGSALLASGGVAVATLVGLATYGAKTHGPFGAAPEGAASAAAASATGPAVDTLLPVSPPTSHVDRRPAVVAAPQQRAQQECRIHGRVVDSDGAPVRHARIVAYGSQANRERVEVFGLPTAWQDPEVLSDESGAFELRFIPPQAFQFSVCILHDELAELGWRWGWILEGEVRDQGTVVLPRPAVIEGHVEGEGGELLVGPWRVQASLRDGKPEHEGVSTRTVAIDPATGGFRFHGLPPGDVLVEALHPRGDRTDGRLVTTSAGEVTRVALRFDGPDPSTRIRVTVVSAGPAQRAASELADGAVRAFSEDGEAYPLQPTARRSRSYTTGALPPGTYRIEVDDPRFLTWSQGDVRPGEDVRAQLAGRAALRLTLLDPEGAPVPRYRLGVRTTEPVVETDIAELLAADAPPPRDGRFEGLLPGAVEVTLGVEGYPEWRGEVRGLGDGRVVDLRVQLTRPRPLTGRVVLADGRPATGGAVEVTRGRAAGHREPGSVDLTSVEVDGEWRSVLVPYRDAAAPLAEDGSFDLGPLGGPRAVLRVTLGAWHCHDVDLELEGLELPLLVAVPPTGAIEGRVLFDGERADEVQVALRREGAGRSVGRAPCRVDEAGRFVLGPVQPGTYELGLVASLGREGRDGGSGSVERRTVRRRIVVEPGAPTACDLDFGHPRSVGVLTVEVTFAGAPAPEGSSVRLEPVGSYDSLGYALDARSAPTERGRARFERVSPGLYTVTVSGVPNWTRTREAQVEVQGGQAARVDFDVDVVIRTLRLVDAEGQAAANRAIGICPADAVAWLSPFETDTAGELQLALPAGAYALAGSSPDGPSRGERTALRDFAWERGAGPLVVVLPASRVR